jgi:hypothetical protein
MTVGKHQSEVESALSLDHMQTYDLLATRRDQWLTLAKDTVTFSPESAYATAVYTANVLSMIMDELQDRWDADKMDRTHVAK